MVGLFEKIESAGFVLPDKLKSEVGIYFNQIENRDIIAQMQNAIVIILNKYKGIEGEQLRVTCLSAILKQTGLDVMHSRAKSCTKKFCDYAIDLFVGKNCKTFEIEDRKLLYRIDEIDDEILEGMKRYYLGEYYKGDTFSSLVNKGCMDILQNRLEGIADLYPDIYRSRIVEYILYYTRTRAYLNPDEDTMVRLVKRITGLGVNFFIYTDKLLISNNDSRLKNLENYIDNLRFLNSSGYPVNELFVNETLGMDEVDVIHQAIKQKKMVSVDIFLESSKKTLEFLSWEINDLPFRKFFNLGYKNINQLRVLRKILQNNLDPLKFQIDPSMSSAEIIVVVDKKLSQYSPTLALMTM